MALAARIAQDSNLMGNRLLLAASALALVATPLASAPLRAGTPVAAAAAKPVYGAWGVDLDARDPTIKPGDDFERYASGHWLAATEIPADKPSIGVSWEMYERTRANLQKLLTEDASSQYGALYASFLDEARVEQVGLAPLMKDIAEVRALPDKRAFARHMGSTYGRFGIALFGSGVSGDPSNPDMNVLWIGQSGLGLPNRDYYTAPTFKPQREAYLAYITRTLTAIGVASPDAAAKKIMALETAIAAKSWAAIQQRDLGKLNNPMSSAELTTYAPGFYWNAFFAGQHVTPQQRMIVGEKSAIRDLAAIYARTPLATLKLWQQFHVANQASRYLTKTMVESRFAFISALAGVRQIEPRWKRAVGVVDGQLGELVGQDYIRHYFPANSKAKMDALVANLKAAMNDRIRGNDWMSQPTKDAALEKLARMDVMVGYPDKFRDFSGLKIDPADLYGNIVRAGLFNAAYELADLGKSVDRRKWSMNPQEVNAYNGTLENKIVFPAGILQAPMFDPAADDAVNYGAIGAIIGHEITHGFDDKGRKIDATGKLHDWWAPSDGERFEQLAAAFGAQYAKYEVIPGLFVNPQLTMGENIADFAGLTVALDAYHRSLGGNQAPVIDGLTGDQRFFLAYAQAWRGKDREELVRMQVTTDPHTPNRYRVLGPLRNIDAWYAAFGVKPGDKLFIPPEQRVRIW